MSAIGELYDTLKKANSGKGHSYAIHKNLKYPDKETTNLYDYLLNKFDLTQKKEILDCGCGVGFGSMLLAKKLDAKVTGISISPTEIESAKVNLNNQKKLTKVIFECKSFDDLDANQYDLIIAIESLKHSPKLSKSLVSIKNALKPGGDIYIIEDIVINPSNGIAKKRLKKDWILKQLYTEREYTEFSKELEWKSYDLTAMMRNPSRIGVAIKIIGTEIKTALDRLLKIRDSATSIFRGGFYQEWLYANHQLKYKLLVGKKL